MRVSRSAGHTEISPLRVQVSCFSPIVLCSLPTHIQSMLHLTLFISAIVLPKLRSILNGCHSAYQLTDKISCPRLGCVCPDGLLFCADPGGGVQELSKESTCPYRCSTGADIVVDHLNILDRVHGRNNTIKPIGKCECVHNCSGHGTCEKTACRSGGGARCRCHARWSTADCSFQDSQGKIREQVREYQRQTEEKAAHLQYLGDLEGKCRGKEKIFCNDGIAAMKGACVENFRNCFRSGRQSLNLTGQDAHKCGAKSKRCHRDYCVPRGASCSPLTLECPPERAFRCKDWTCAFSEAHCNSKMGCRASGVQCPE